MPFLDILCSLIGVLILIIVVMVIAQSQQTEGRTQEEVDRSLAYKQLLKKQEEQTQTQKKTEELIKAMAEEKKELNEKEERAARLRKLLATSADTRKSNQEISMNLVKELDNLLLEIDGHKRQQAELAKEIAKLNQEIAKRKPPPKEAVPPVVVQPGGSGTGQESKLFFVEAGAGKIVLFWDEDKRTQVSAAAEVIVADKAYEHFLTTVKGTPNAKLVFLIRSDGMSAYNNAAGWAMETYKLAVSQIGKLPIPGVGAIDLKEFKKVMGTMAPPAEAKLLPAPGATPPPAPAKAAAPKAATPAASPKAATPAPAAAPKAPETPKAAPAAEPAKKA